MDISEREAAIRADLEWIQDLNDALHDADYARLLHYLKSQPPTEEMLKRGLTAEKLAEFYGFEGETTMSKLTRALMGDLRSEDFTEFPEDIIFSYAAIPTVNGLCLKLPNLDSPAIILNHGLVAYIATATHLTLGLTYWTDGEYCHHHAKEEHLEGLFQLAVGIHERKPAALLEISAANCIGAEGHGLPELLYEMYCTFADAFIVFHEIGHIALGHLNPSDVSHTFESEGQKLPVFNRSQLNELAADKFALAQLVRTYTKYEVSQKDLIYGVGCLMVLMRAIEVVSPRWASETHPPALQRWQSLKEELGLPSEPSMVNSIDYFFDWVDELVKEKGL